MGAGFDKIADIRPHINNHRPLLVKHAKNRLYGAVKPLVMPGTYQQADPSQFLTDGKACRKKHCNEPDKEPQ